jgi:hypothetical protein
MIPKLDYLKIADTKPTSGFVEYMDTIQADQGEDFASILAVCGMLNPEMIRGFIVCYMLIRDTFIAASTSQLEDMFKEDKK